MTATPYGFAVLVNGWWLNRSDHRRRTRAPQTSVRHAERRRVRSAKATYGQQNRRYGSDWPAVHRHHPGMHPPPNDPRKLYKECNRIAWALRVKHQPRAKLAIVLDRYDAQIVALRRQHDAYLAALEVIDPELHRRAVEHLRDLDDPKKAIEWELRAGGVDDV